MTGPLTRRRELTADLDDERRGLTPSQLVRLRDRIRRAEARRRDRLAAEGRALLAEYLDGDDVSIREAFRRFMDDLKERTR